MKEVKEAVKRFFIWICAVAASAFAIVAVKRQRGTTVIRNQPEIKEDKEIEYMAERRRQEAACVISNTPASHIAEGHEAVRTAIDRGISRFRDRCAMSGRKTDCGRGNKDCRGGNKEN